MSTTKPFTVYVRQGKYMSNEPKLSEAGACFRHFPLYIYTCLLMRHVLTASAKWEKNHAPPACFIFFQVR